MLAPNGAVFDICQRLRRTILAEGIRLSVGTYCWTFHRSADKLRPCPSYSTRRDRNNFVRSLIMYEMWCGHVEHGFVVTFTNFSTCGPLLVHQEIFFLSDASHRSSMANFSTFGLRTCVSAVVCVACKPCPCPSYSRCRARNNCVHWHSLYRGRGVPHPWRMAQGA